MEATQQKNLVDQQFPFNMFIDDESEFPPHWHKELEIVYVLEGMVDMGLNSRIYTLRSRDIFLAGKGEVHYFLPHSGAIRKIIIHFDLAMLESISPEFQEYRWQVPLIRGPASGVFDFGEAAALHRDLEEQILALDREYTAREAGYKIAMMARLCDLYTGLIRRVPLERHSRLESDKHWKQLERLELVFRFVAAHYAEPVQLAEAAAAAGFSVFHFTRFFKDATGMTFLQYLHHYRIARAARSLGTTTEPVIDIALQSGFDSIQSFNRVFKQLKGCSPSQYRKRFLETE
ncbi:AraC-like DNA-binding protein [Hydrogenispora ethanolica]|uniref:AraC-like DNA-binding protein n=1 Tax=Hydrogenispora ethanolica TaxID=1082276 RepID=A0A4R1RU08_HYDET|nr:AraC family transcriptional regulator [Hydrogenispora ethanolica]TCL70031.1 AraC-like DNA-binding protein [Hydrogenispora ethanolica]